MRRMTVLGLLLGSVVAGPANGAATEPGEYYVTAEVLNVRLAPASNARITNRLHRQHQVNVHEVTNSWARISEYYDGAVEGEPGQIARWVAAKHLSSTRPKDGPEPATMSDSRIGEYAIPKVGQGGPTKCDIEILFRGAIYFLDSGSCKKLEFADKSTTKPNTYYLNCGGPNIFFRVSDLP